MHGTFVVELRITDYIDKSYFRPDDTGYHLHVITQFQEQLEEIIGGMLCTQHVNLPVMQPLCDTEDGWVLKIACCCKMQFQSVHERVNLLLK